MFVLLSRGLLNNEIPLLTDLAVVVLATVVLERSDFIRNELYNYRFIERGVFFDTEFVEHEVVRAGSISDGDFNCIPLLDSDLVQGEMGGHLVTLLFHPRSHGELFHGNGRILNASIRVCSGVQLRSVGSLVFTEIHIAPDQKHDGEYRENGFIHVVTI